MSCTIKRFPRYQNQNLWQFYCFTFLQSTTLHYIAVHFGREKFISIESRCSLLGSQFYKSTRMRFLKWLSNTVILAHLLGYQQTKVKGFLVEDAVWLLLLLHAFWICAILACSKSVSVCSAAELQQQLLAARSSLVAAQQYFIWLCTLHIYKTIVKVLVQRDFYGSVRDLSRLLYTSCQGLLRY